MLNKAQADLNTLCQCYKIDKKWLAQALANVGITTQPSFFAASATYLTKQQLQWIQQTITAIESVIKLPAYQAKVLAKAPTVAQLSYPAAGVFMGYDFHLSPQGPQLIEINTNAGGALLNVLLVEALRPCHHQAASRVEDNVREKIIAMFRQEWRLTHPNRPLRSIAIMDAMPQQQHLYPDFLLFKQLFEQHGIQTVIVDPDELKFNQGKLWFNRLAIDLVYNRSTDFYFEQYPQLAEAYQTKAAAITPHPRAHALYANKQNLETLTNIQQLKAWNIDAQIIETLVNSIPHTFKVDPTKADELWQQRKSLFFKPLAGYGGRGTYRGDRITHKVFNEILTHNYVAQTYAPPSERHLLLEGKEQVFKVDIRCYVYQGLPQFIAARLYQGQTTNFRTPGSGFSPVI